MVPRPSQGADKLTFNFLRMFVRQISFRFACRYLGPSRTPVPTILFCRNCLSIYQFVVCIVCRWAGGRTPPLQQRNYIAPINPNLSSCILFFGINISITQFKKPLYFRQKICYSKAVRFLSGSVKPQDRAPCLAACRTFFIKKR